MVNLPWGVRPGTGVPERSPTHPSELKRANMPAFSKESTVSPLPSSLPLALTLPAPPYSYGLLPPTPPAAVNSGRNAV